MLHEFVNLPNIKTAREQFVNLIPKPHPNPNSNSVFNEIAQQ